MKPFLGLADGKQKFLLSRPHIACTAVYGFWIHYMLDRSIGEARTRTRGARRVKTLPGLDT